MIKKFLRATFIILFLPNILFAKSEFFQEGMDLYNKSKFKDAKFKFEQDIVFNPKSELSIYTFLKYLKNLIKKI